MQTYKISIPKPCTEDWDKMTKTDQGKLCVACNKVVIDFTGMSTQEILHVLLNQKGKKVCGNFYNTQIKNPIQYMAPTRKMKWPAMAAMLVAGLFTVAPAITHAQRNTEKVVHPVSVRIDQSGTNETINTEPGKDSLITYKIKVKSFKTNTTIAGAQINITDVGSFTSDKNGMVVVSISMKDVPEFIQVDCWASGFETSSQTIYKTQLEKNKKLEIFLAEEERYMMRGDVSIDH